MAKRPRSFVTRIQAEGQKLERSATRDETYQEARKYVDKCPRQNPDKLMYIRNLTTKAKKGEINRDVFELVIKLTNSWLELETCLPRIEQTLGITRSKGK